METLRCLHGSVLLCIALHRIDDLDFTSYPQPLFLIQNSKQPLPWGFVEWIQSRVDGDVALTLINTAQSLHSTRLPVKLPESDPDARRRLIASCNAPETRSSDPAVPVHLDLDVSPRNPTDFQPLSRLRSVSSRAVPVHRGSTCAPLHSVYPGQKPHKFW